tara:strand:- start:13 stop:432 length:420 start_codon:yes stop_codon:yes gene_type:complete
MWSEDCRINNNKLDESSAQSPVLHAKYLRLLSEAKLMLKKVERDQKVLLKDKWLYYNGKMDQKQLDSKGWNPDPFDGLKVMKGEMEHYYNSDPEIQRSEEKVEYWKTIISTLQEIVDNVKWRHQTIGNIIRWKQFEAGM